jgi:hypothetical protein
MTKDIKGALGITIPISSGELGANNKKARLNDIIVQASPSFILWGLEGNCNPSVDPSDRFLSFSLKSVSRFTGTAPFRRCPLKGSTLL